jgi:hypothetical protein
MLHAEYFRKTLRFLRNRHFYLFWGGFVWGLHGGGLTGKCQSFVRDLSFWPARRTPRQFSQKVQGTDQFLCAFWTAGFTPRPPDIGSVWCILIFQVSNRTIGCILDRSARLYGNCMEPDHTAKYSLPVLLPIWLKISSKKKTQLFMCWPPYSSEGVCGRVSALCVHPCGFCIEKSNIDETIEVLFVKQTLFIF